MLRPLHRSLRPHLRQTIFHDPGVDSDDAYDAYEALEIEAADLLEELEEDGTAEANEAPPAPAKQSAIARARPARTDTTFEPLTLEEAQSAMQAATKRSQIANALLGLCRWFLRSLDTASRAGRGWLLAGRDLGPELEPGRLDGLLIPLEAPSLFQVAVKSGLYFQDRVFPATLHSYLFKVLRCSAPAESVACGSFRSAAESSTYFMVIAPSARTSPRPRPTVSGSWCVMLALRTSNSSLVRSQTGKSSSHLSDEVEVELAQALVHSRNVRSQPPGRGACRRRVDFSAGPRLRAEPASGH